jgi:multidrug resistance efflux pump
MLHRTAALTTCLLVAAVPAASAVLAADPPPKAAASTHRVGLVPFKIEARFEGVFESPTMVEVRVDPKRWTQLVVTEAVPHGTRVGKGDVVVTIETEKLDEAIRDLEIGGRLADLTHALMERELASLEKATPRQLEFASRARRIAEEDLKRYEEQEQALNEAANDANLKMSEFSRENAEEELAQLEKMYEQDDLTEETEEIVLKRARFQAEVARLYEKFARDNHERSVALGLPRRLESIRKTAEAAALEQEHAEATLPLALDKLRLELEKSANERRKAAAQLADLKADRRRLPITAPTDGVVYYGRWRQGKWIDGEAAAQRLRPGGQLDPRETAITIVGGGKLHLRAAVAEKDLGRVPVQAVAKVAPRAFPEPVLAGHVRSLSPVPVAPGRFEAVIDLTDERPQLVAGMEADIRVVADFRPEVLAVPRKAVFVEDLDDAKRYVLVVPEAGKEPVKRTVAVGRSNDELTEVTAGLSVDEEILLEKPAPARKEPAAAKAEPAPKPEAEKKPAAANTPASTTPAAPSK